jgi:hypothetical protein
MTKTELNIRVELHERELDRLRSIKVHCQSCEHYVYYGRPHCKKFEVDPPPEVVAAGCDEWSYDFIPF